MLNVGSVFHGSESILYSGPKIWDIVPLELKELTSVVAFKEVIKEWMCVCVCACVCVLFLRLFLFKVFS